MTLNLAEPYSDPWADGVVCAYRYVEDERGRHLGEIIFAPEACGDGANRLEPGWNAFADYGRTGRLAPDLCVTRFRGLPSERSAIRALLAQLDVNDRVIAARDASPKSSLISE